MMTVLLLSTTCAAVAADGPTVVSVRPGAGTDAIDVEQHFLLTLSTAVAEASLAGHAWCEVAGVPERLPLIVDTGTPRDEALKANNVLDPAVIARTLLVHCGRTLPHDTAVRVVWGRGIAAATRPAVVTVAEQRFRFKTRGVFTAGL